VQPLEGSPVARVLVAGASGLAGALGAELVWRHPKLELVAVSSRSDIGARLDRVHPRRRVPLALRELDLAELEEVDAAVVGYPHGAAAPLVAELRGLGAAVVDLSADFRLRDLPSYERWYGPHGEPDLLAGSVYGLPELNRARVREADLVANPGCYPTAALLALAPLAEAGLIADVVISAASGVSGAGRGGADFVSVAENFTAYAVEGHRHQPEIEQELRQLIPAASSQRAPASGDPGEAGFRPGAAGSDQLRLTFLTHLLPIDQGLLATCFVEPTRAVSAAELEALYTTRYGDEPFIEVVDEPPGVRDVRETNVCRVFATLAPGSGRVLAFAAIDNLWKGAAGQAIQNLNLMLGIDEAEGLA
jgi:N-acetyl-gamma-glutamyl-phosphate reductase